MRRQFLDKSLTFTISFSPTNDVGGNNTVNSSRFLLSASCVTFVKASIVHSIRKPVVYRTRPSSTARKLQQFPDYFTARSIRFQHTPWAATIMETFVAAPPLVLQPWKSFTIARANESGHVYNRVSRCFQKLAHVDPLIVRKWLTQRDSISPVVNLYANTEFPDIKFYWRNTYRNRVIARVHLQWYYIGISAIIFTFLFSLLSNHS